MSVGQFPDRRTHHTALQYTHGNNTWPLFHWATSGKPKGSEELLTAHSLGGDHPKKV